MASSLSSKPFLTSPSTDGASGFGSLRKLSFPSVRYAIRPTHRRTLGLSPLLFCPSFYSFLAAFLAFEGLLCEGSVRIFRIEVFWRFLVFALLLRLAAKEVWENEINYYFVSQIQFNY